MPERPTLIAVLAFLVGLALSPVSLLGIQSQERQLALLAKERAEISRMDWVLLNAEVSVLRTIFVNTLKVPISPMRVYYDEDRNRIVWNANVDFAWYAKATLEDVKRLLEEAALTYCLDGITLSIMMHGRTFVPGPPIEFCSVSFSKLALNESGELTREGVASYANGQLVLK